MTAYRAGTARVSSTVTKTVGTNPRPRKYATASERQAAYRARAPEVCFRAEAKTVETLDNIADTLDQSRADLLLSMTKFALANHDWARFGLTHKPLPYGYGVQPATNPAPIWKRKRPKSLGKPVPLTPKQKAAAKAMAKAAGRKYPNLVDNIAASRLENPTVKKPTPAQLAARAKFAEMARSGAFKRKAKAGKRKANPVDVAGGRYEILWGGSGDLKASYDDLGKAKDFLDDIDRPPGLFYGRDTKTGKHFFSFAAVTKFPNIDIRGTAMQKAYKANPRKKTVSEKISQLVREGYPQKQAVAVALSEERAGKVKRNPRAANPAKFTASQLAALRDQYSMIKAIDPSSESYIALTARLDALSLPILKQLADAKIKWVSALARNRVTRMERKPNPATGAKKSRTKLNPTSSSRFKYVCIAPLEYSGAKYGIDERTPVTLKFTKTEPAAHLVYACYELPSRLVQNDDFQNFAYHNKVIYMSLAELKMLLKGYMK